MPEGARFGVRSITVTKLMDDVLTIYHKDVLEFVLKKCSRSVVGYCPSGLCRFAYRISDDIFQFFCSSRDKYGFMSCILLFI